MAHAQTNARHLPSMAIEEQAAIRPQPTPTTNKLDPSKRVVLEPLTGRRSRQPDAAAYYSQRAVAGGRLVTEAAPGGWTTEQVEAWRPIFDTVHHNGATLFCQLVAPPPYGPAQPRRPAQKKIIDGFRKAARSVIDAGFDGVEIHAAHGYHEEHGANDRDLEGRYRMIVEVVAAVVEEIGGRHVGILLSPLDNYATVLQYMCSKLNDGILYMVDPRTMETASAFARLSKQAWSKCVDKGHGTSSNPYCIDESSSEEEDVRPPATAQKLLPSSAASADRQIVLVGDVLPTAWYTSTEMADHGTQVSRLRLGGDSPLVVPADVPAPVRRSSRKKSRPLDEWRGEKMLYRRIEKHMPTVIGIKKYSAGEDGKVALRVESFLPDEYSDMVAQAGKY